MKHIAIFLFIFSSSVSYSQDTISHRYFPLKVGNEWTYYSYTELPPSSFKFKVKITKDTLIEGKKYYFIIAPNLMIYNGWVRYDSSSTCLIKRSDGNGCGVFPNDKIIDSLGSAVGRQVNCFINPYSLRRCILISYPVGILGFTNKHRKVFLHDGLIYANASYMSDVGLTSYCSGEPPPCQNFANLTGCVLNGVVYGDTNLTDISNSSEFIYNSYILNQNYPNPFNPVTTISFYLPVNSEISLNIIDLNGREVMKPIENKKLNQGNHSLNINMSNFPSGVYYYKIKSGSFMQSKKMVLVK